MTQKTEGKTAELKITTNYGPIYDTRYDLNQLVAFLGVVLYLACPDDEDPAKADIITALCCLQEKLAECAEALDGAWKEGILSEEKSAPAVDPDKNVFSRLAICREIYDSFKDSERLEDVDALTIHLRLNELSDFIIQAANPAIKLKEDFLALLNDNAARQKISAAVSAAAGG